MWFSCTNSTPPFRLTINTYFWSSSAAAHSSKPTVLWNFFRPPFSGSRNTKRNSSVSWKLRGIVHSISLKIKSTVNKLQSLLTRSCQTFIDFRWRNFCILLRAVNFFTTALILSSSIAWVIPWSAQASGIWLFKKYVSSNTTRYYFPQRTDHTLDEDFIVPHWHLLLADVVRSGVVVTHQRIVGEEIGEKICYIHGLWFLER